MKTTSPSLFLTAAAVLLAVALLPVQQAHAASSTWATNAAGNWSLAANWSSGVPGTAGSGTNSTDIATFNRSLLSASRIVTLDANYNVGGITISNDSPSPGTAFTYTLTNSSSSVLTLTPNAVVQNVGAGTNTGVNLIDLNITLAGNAAINNSYSNSVLQIGNSSGTSAQQITTLTDLGNIDLTIGGTSTGSSLMSIRLNQATGTTLRLVKEGTGFWQLNGPSSGSQGMTGGLLIRQGGVSVGRNNALSIGAGDIVLGDTNTVAGALTLLTGSGVTLSNNITVASSAATSVIIERQATGGDSVYQGTITLERDLILRQNTTGTSRNLNIASNSKLTGTGDVIIDTTLVGATGPVTLGGGSFTGTGSINMTGRLINQSSTGAGGVAVNGKILENVTGVVQNSATSTMTLTNSANAYTGKTTVTAGTLAIGGNGTIGNSDLEMNGGIFNITGATTGLTITNGRSVTGRGSIVTTGKTFTIEGALKPGGATNETAGKITVTGNLILGSTAATTVKLAGTNGVAGTDFDQMDVSGTLTLSGSLLITNYSSFNLTTPGSYNLFDWGSKSGNFSSVSVGATALSFADNFWTGSAGLSAYSFSTLDGGFTITAIPEPSTVVAALGLAGLMLWPARRRLTALLSRRA